MEKVLEKFKALYQGEDRLKRHGMLLVVLLLPSILCCMNYVIDKETPKEIIIPALIVLAVLMVLSIIPLFFLSGFFVDFYRSRIKSKIGLPEINLQTFVKGLKVFPLQFVWGLYAMIIAFVGFILPIILIVSYFVSSHNKAEMVGVIILFVIVFAVLNLILSVLFMVVTPFYNYIYLSFIEDFVYRPEYFNPLTLVYYIKKVFKDTMITMLKFMLASIVVNMVVQTVLTIILVVVFIFAGIGTAATTSSEPALANYLVFLLLVLPICTLAGLTQNYVNTMVTCAVGDAYTDIYKEQLRIPDPLENVLENKEADENIENNENNDNNETQE